MTDNKDKNVLNSLIEREQNDSICSAECEKIKGSKNLNEEHKRHYITEIQPYSCVLPDDKILKTIALMFESITEKLANEQLLALMLNKQKQYLLSKMFI